MSAFTDTTTYRVSDRLLVLTNFIGVRQERPMYFSDQHEGLDEHSIDNKVHDTDPLEVMDHDDRRNLRGISSFQVYRNITRPQLVSAHAKWLFCSSAYWLNGDTCEKTQKFVPKGYWFETGRPTNTQYNCDSLTGNGDVTVVDNCNVKKGLIMVLAVITNAWVGCKVKGEGVLEDPRQAPAELALTLPSIVAHKTNLDGKPIHYFNSLKVMTQDGDLDYRLSGDASCVENDFDGWLPGSKGCPVGASGHYVFINTKKLSKGKHELLLIGQDYQGWCSAVKHKFTIV